MHTSRSVGQTQPHIHRLSGEFVTQGGDVLGEVDLAYELYGCLLYTSDAADDRPRV